jgi:isopenicillin N synthase-like dioxygenase
MSTLPVVDLSAEPAGTARAIEVACRRYGFFYLTGHGVPAAALDRLDRAARAFFRLPLAGKMEIEMARGGAAWRGYFPVGAELTDGRPDRKEGLYFGTELPDDDPRAGLPLHGRNLFPRQVPELRDAVLSYMDALGQVAQEVLRRIAVSLSLPAEHFASRYTARPTVLFRVFHYPAAPPDSDDWGVGEHTDYGLLTLLAQDDNGGLSVRTPDGWLDAPPVPGTFVCNIGDMLDRLTGGWYRSTPHRVSNVSGRDRLSFPYFFDPDFTAPVGTGTYGDYLVAKVAKVFPGLRPALGQAATLSRPDRLPR